MPSVSLSKLLYLFSALVRLLLANVMGLRMLLSSASSLWQLLSKWGFGHCFCRIISDVFSSKSFCILPMGWVLVGTTLGIMTGLVTTGCGTALGFGSVIWPFFLSTQCVCFALASSLRIFTRVDILKYCVGGCHSLDHSHGRTTCLYWYIFIWHWTCASWIWAVLPTVTFLSTLKTC